MWAKIKFLIKNRKILLFSGILIALISFFATLTAIGTAIGYFTSKYFAGKKEGMRGKINSLILKIGEYKVHIHHWLIGVSLLCLSIFEILPIHSPFYKGLIIGITLQGIFDYRDWYKIIKR